MKLKQTDSSTVLQNIDFDQDFNLIKPFNGLEKNSPTQFMFLASITGVPCKMWCGGHVSPGADWSSPC